MPRVRAGASNGGLTGGDPAGALVLSRRLVGASTEGVHHDPAHARHRRLRLRRARLRRLAGARLRPRLVRRPSDAWSRLADGARRGPSSPGRSRRVGTPRSTRRVSARGRQRALSQRTVVPGIAGLEDWYAAGDGLQRDRRLEGGRRHLRQARRPQHRLRPCTSRSRSAPTPRPSRCAAPARRPSPRGVAADGAGGVYVWCTLSPTRGHRCRRHAAEPRLVVGRAAPRRTRASPSPGARSRPGRRRRRARRSSCSALPAAAASPSSATPHDLTADWARSDLALQPARRRRRRRRPSPSASSPASSATIAWRESDQGARCSASRRGGSGSGCCPPAVTMTGAVRLADDGLGGVYLVGPVRRRHRRAPRPRPPAPRRRAPASALPGLGLSQPRVDAWRRTAPATSSSPTATRRSAPACPASRYMTCLGAWSDVGPVAAIPGSYTAAVPDGTGGAYVARRRRATRILWRIANGRRRRSPSAPASRLVQYGKTRHRSPATRRGAGGLPVSVACVQVGKVTAASLHAGATGTDGRRWLLPDVARSPRPTRPGRRSPAAPRATPCVIRVMPRVTLALSHLKAGHTAHRDLQRPGHAGPPRPARAHPEGRRLGLAHGRLGPARQPLPLPRQLALPYKTATYKLRAVVPAHADHAEGASPTGDPPGRHQEGVERERRLRRRLAYVRRGGGPFRPAAPSAFCASDEPERPRARPACRPRARSSRRAPRAAPG